MLFEVYVATGCTPENLEAKLPPPPSPLEAPSCGGGPGFPNLFGECTCTSGPGAAHDHPTASRVKNRDAKGPYKDPIRTL